MSESHELADFMQQVVAELQSEYERISQRSPEDPGTAGDDTEENWAEILRNWLPAGYQVVTKGRILTSLGEASPQVDVLVLSADYPKGLLNKKYYLSAWVIAAFECKKTLKKNGIDKTYSNSKQIAAMCVRETLNSGYWKTRPFTDPVHAALHSPITYGLLAHSHSWKEDGAIDLITSKLTKHMNDLDHPRGMIDLICVADLAVWSAYRTANKFVFRDAITGAIISGKGPHRIDPNNMGEYLQVCTSSYAVLHKDIWPIGSVYHGRATTIGFLMSRLYSKLSRGGALDPELASYWAAALKDGMSTKDGEKVWGDLLPREVRAAVSKATSWISYE